MSATSSPADCCSRADGPLVWFAEPPVPRYRSHPLAAHSSTGRRFATAKPSLDSSAYGRSAPVCSRAIGPSAHGGKAAVRMVCGTVGPALLAWSARPAVSHYSHGPRDLRSRATHDDLARFCAVVRPRLTTAQRAPPHVDRSVRSDTWEVLCVGRIYTRPSDSTTRNATNSTQRTVPAASVTFSFAFSWIGMLAYSSRKASRFSRS